MICNIDLISYFTHKSVWIWTQNQIGLYGGEDEKEQAAEGEDWSGGTLKWEEEDEAGGAQREIWRRQLTCKSSRWKYKIRLRWKKAGGGRGEPTHLFDRRRLRNCDEEEWISQRAALVWGRLEAHVSFYPQHLHLATSTFTHVCAITH